MKLNTINFYNYILFRDVKLKIGMVSNTKYKRITIYYGINDIMSHILNDKKQNTTGIKI